MFSFCTLIDQSRSFNCRKGSAAVAGAQPLGGRLELAAGGEGVAAARRAHRACIAGAVEDGGEALDGVAVGTFIGGARPGIERDEIDLGGNSLEQLDQTAGVLPAIIT